MPPAASTGTGATASTIIGMSGMLAMPADVAAAFGALRDDDVGAGLGGAHRLRHGAGHVA